MIYGAFSPFRGTYQLWKRTEFPSISPDGFVGLEVRYQRDGKVDGRRATVAKGEPVPDLPDRTLVHGRQALRDGPEQFPSRSLITISLADETVQMLLF